LEWDKGIKIKRPRKVHHLPDILSKQEVNTLIEVTTNPKHKAIIGLLYSTGMRRGELLNLRLADIDSTRMVVRISNGKGNKARDTLLAERALKLLRVYYRHTDPKPIEYVFEGGW
jgi:site-specific recombinase XerD